MRYFQALPFAIAAVALSAERPSYGQALAPRTESRSLTCSASSNFLVRTSGAPSATEVLTTCEKLRAQLQTTWLGEVVPASWRPRCEVVVHRSRAAYQQAVGRGAGGTSGSSLVRFEKGRAVVRRIDLLANANGQTTALAHELTHIVLADRFRGRQPPRWVDEGVATLADSGEKQRRHQRDCQYALSGGTAVPLQHLFRLEQCTSYEQAAAFYGQSLSLVGYLVERGTPVRFLKFVELAMDRGYDRALDETYGIDDLAELDRRWREYAFAYESPPQATRLAAYSNSDE